MVRRIAEVNGADSSTLVLALKPKPHLFKQADPRELFTPGKKLNTTLPVTVLWLAMGLSFYGTSLLLVRASGATDFEASVPSVVLEVMNFIWFYKAHTV